MLNRKHRKQEQKENFHLPPSLFSPAAMSRTDFFSNAAPGVIPTIDPPDCPSISTTSPVKFPFPSDFFLDLF